MQICLRYKRQLKSIFTMTEVHLGFLIYCPSDGGHHLTSFSFDLETRKSYMQIQLVGESETIDIWFEGFAIITTNMGSYSFYIEQAGSNRIWLRNILSRIVRKEWKIPVTPQTTAHIEFIAELLKVKSPV